METRFRPPLLLRLITVLLIVISAAALVVEVLRLLEIGSFTGRPRVSRLVTNGFLLHGAIRMWRGDREGVSSLLWWLPIYALLFSAVLFFPGMIDEKRRPIVLGASGVMIAVTTYLWWCSRRWDSFWGVPPDKDPETMLWHDDPPRD